MEDLRIEGKRNSIINRNNTREISKCSDNTKDSDDEVCDEISETSDTNGKDTNDLEILSKDDNEISTFEEENYELATIKLDRRFVNKVKIRTVPVLDRDGQEKYLAICVINLGWTKPWCGGFRNVKTKKIYWNAYSQTNLTGSGQLIKWPVQEKQKITRDTQTYLNSVSRGMNTVCVKKTQTPLVFEEDYERIVIPFKFQPKEEKEMKRNRVKNAVLVIQKWVKRYIAMKDFQRHKQFEKSFKALELKRKQKKDLVKETLKLSMKSVVSDKAQLFSLEREVNEWKERELQKIIDTKKGATKYAALYELFEKEIRYLHQYEAIRIKFKHDQEELLKDKFLEIMATSTSKKAKDLKQLYDLYIFTEGNKERIEALDNIIKTINKNYLDYEWADYLKDLLRRECAMLNAGYKEMDFNNLQVRTQDLIFDLLTNAEFNPLAEVYTSKTKVGKVKPYTRPTKQKEKQTTWIKHCKITKNLTPYSVILKKLRNHENELTSNSWTCWKVSVTDIYYLIDIIWNGRSILSENKNIEELKLLRWDIYIEWAPWNCILLTEDEAILHSEVTDANHVYNSTLLKKIELKHMVAKMRFRKLFNNYMKHLFFQEKEQVANDKEDQLEIVI